MLSYYLDQCRGVPPVLPVQPEVPHDLYRDQGHYSAWKCDSCGSFFSGHPAIGPTSLVPPLLCDHCRTRDSRSALSALDGRYGRVLNRRYARAANSRRRYKHE